MQSSARAISSLTAITALINSAICLTYSVADGTAEAPDKSPKIANISNFQVAQQPIIENIKADTIKLFGQIEDTRKLLAGKHPWHKSKEENQVNQDAENARKFQQLLSEAARKTDVRIVAAILADTQYDDYVRLAAWSVITKFGYYTIEEHLLLLCKTFLILPKRPPDAYSPVYYTANPEINQIRIAKLVGGLLRIDIEPKTEEDDRPQTWLFAISNPRVWLKTVLEQSLLKEQDAGRKKVIESCLHELNLTDTVKDDKVAIGQ